MTIKWTNSKKWANSQEKKKYNLPKLNHGKIGNKTRPITSTEIRILSKGLPTNKSPWPDGLAGEFYQKLREELKPILHKILQKIKEGGKLPNLFYKAAITLIAKPEKTATIKKISLVNVISLVQKSSTGAKKKKNHWCKNPQRNYSKDNQKTHYKDHTSWSSGLYPMYAKSLQYGQMNQCNTLC